MFSRARLTTVPDWKTALLALAVAVLAMLSVLWPGHAVGALVFAVVSLIDVAPLIVPGIVVAAWIIASRADAHIARAFEGRTTASVLAASAIGAITPVCGVTVLPLMAGLLVAGVPLAPIMAFWLASPVTDPAILAATVATLGVNFAVGKTLAAAALGVAGGLVTAVVAQRSWVLRPLRDSRLAQAMGETSCGGRQPFEPRIWQTPQRRRAFARQALATSRLIVVCLIPAFAAEYVLNATLTPGAMAAHVGEDSWWAIPAAVFVGAPAYIDGYAALPLVRALIDNGMSKGAAMAFLVSGGVVSIWGAMAIAPVLKLQPFLLYLALALLGSLAAGYAFEWLG